MDDAFVHWGVALEDAKADYEGFVLCAESQAPSHLEDVLRAWYRQAVSMEIV